MFFLSFKTISAHDNQNHEEVDQSPRSLILILFSALLITTIPLIIGLATVIPMEKLEILKKKNYLVPFGISFGAILFLLFDYASLSGIFVFQIRNLQFQLVKILIFSVILIYISLYVGDGNTIDKDRIYYLWVLGIFIHTIGEGIIMGNNFTLGLQESFVPLAVLSFIMHKFIEGVIAATLFDKTKPDQLNKILTHGFIVSLGIVPGIYLGYLGGSLGFREFVELTNSLSFLIGFTFVVYIAVAIIPENPYRSDRSYIYAIIVGFIFMFLSIIFHEI